MKTFTKSTLFAAGFAAAVLPFLHAANDTTEKSPARESRQRPGLRALVRHHAVRKQVARKLDLTADQIAELKSARGEIRTSIRAIRSDASLATEEKKAKVRALLQATRGQMRGLLTPDQQETLGGMRERLRGVRRGVI